jgi:hypothetical protein
MRTVTVSHDGSGDISRHWIAINLFLETNNPSHLAAFVGRGCVTAIRFAPKPPQDGLRSLKIAGDIVRSRSSRANVTMPKAVGLSSPATARICSMTRRFTGPILADPAGGLGSSR